MSITSATRLLVLLGDPVSHSLSPLMHNGWIADHGLDAVYVALRLESANPTETIRALKALDIAGANITVPHKEAAARAADVCDGIVANTLHWGVNGVVSAFNTDGPGFLDALSEAAPNWAGQVRRVLIIGAGGAALAIGKGLSPRVDTVCFINRTLARAQAAAESLGNGQHLRWEAMERGFADADLIVQATTLGLAGAPAPAWPVAHCRASTIVADIVYRPLQTELLRVARARGLTAMDGLGMLIHQGARAFEIWFGVRPDAATARARLLAALAS